MKVYYTQSLSDSTPNVQAIGNLFSDHPKAVSSSRMNNSPVND